MRQEVRQEHEVINQMINKTTNGKQRSKTINLRG